MSVITQLDEPNELQRECYALEVATARMLNRMVKMIEGDAPAGMESRYLDGLMDSREPYVDPDGEVWAPIGYGMAGEHARQPYVTEVELTRIRDLCRWLSNENEFAINAHENRVSYIVGWGFTPTVTAKDGEEIPDDALQAIQTVIDEFVKLNRWHSRQQEIIWRRDRDGECFIRKFRAADGILRVRFVEPEHITEPPGAQPHQSFGIETDPFDIETVIQYWLSLDGRTWQQVPAEEMQHRKSNADSSCKRGVPLMWPVRKNLVRAGKILRNMGAVTEIQSAIAMIRKHMQATHQAVQAFAASAATRVSTDQNGKPTYQKKYEPGSILDAPQGIEYEFPNTKTDPSKWVSALDAHLRAIAARLVMPEYMFTSNASNANFASTLVAENPATKMFERCQYDEVEFDREIFMSALEFAAAMGRFPEADLERIELAITPPPVQSRDRLKDAQVAQILDTLGYLSPQTGCAEFGYEYEQEQNNIEQHQERNGGPLGLDRPGVDDDDPLGLGDPSDPDDGNPTPPGSDDGKSGDGA